jgi:D-3-phosphoglycerate dehydrogenase
VDEARESTDGGDGRAVGGTPPFRVFVYERIDPSDASLLWLEDRGVHIGRGQALWRQPVGRYRDDEIIEAARGYDAVMGASGARFSRRVIEALPGLRAISKFGVGVETIDLAAATERGILVSNTPDETYAMAVAEHALALILGLKKQLPNWNAQYMRSGGWRPGFFAELLFDNTVGLIGLGRIGREVASRLAGWGVKILAYDPYVTNTPQGVTSTDLRTLLAEADVVSLHATPSSENHHLIDAAAFARMKPGAILINVGRASLVDTAALTEALASGRIAGAAVDVYDVEPPNPADPLFGCPNALFTPHAASWTRSGVEKTGWRAARNLWAMLSGEGQADIVNPAARRSGQSTPPKFETSGDL